MESDPCDAGRRNLSRRHGSTGPRAGARDCESGSEQPARTRSCNDAKQLMDRHENDKWSTARTNESLSEASSVNMSVMGDSWDKKLEDWVEVMRIVDAEAKKPKGAENESVERWFSTGRIVLNKCELLLEIKRHCRRSRCG